jgi:hypothetical protein
MIYIRVLLIGALVAVLPSGGAAAGSESTRQVSLYGESAAHVISGIFADCRTVLARKNQFCSQAGETSYLLLDAHTGTVLASNWPHPEVPMPLGSLVKPFTALAYGEEHQFRFPVHFCRGTASGCWRPGGHGELGLESAIANSCNSYFRALTASMRARDVLPVATIFGLQAPDPTSPPVNLTGIGATWAISPLAMARAYAELVRRRGQPGISEIVDGMGGSAHFGTGAEIGRALEHTAALAKTGTAPCTHARHAPGDGFAIALLPAADPQILLMVRVHGVPGSHAAKMAGQILRRIEE